MNVILFSLSNSIFIVCGFLFSLYPSGAFISVTTFSPICTFSVIFPSGPVVTFFIFPFSLFSIWNIAPSSPCPSVFVFSIVKFDSFSP